MSTTPGAFWRRTPLLLRHYRMVALAVAGAGLILAVSGAAAPLFLSSAQNGALARQFASYCSWSPARAFDLQSTAPITGTEVVPEYTGIPGSPSFQEHKVSVSAAAAAVRRDALTSRLVAGVSHLGPVERTQIADVVVNVIGRGGAAHAQPDQLVLRDGQFGHIDVLSSAGGRGIWLTDTAASYAGARAGDQVELVGDSGRVHVRVAGVYRDLATEPRVDFWCTLGQRIYQPGPTSSASAPPPLALATDEATLQALSRGLGSPPFDIHYERQLLLPLTLPQATQVAAEFGQVSEQLNAPTPDAPYGLVSTADGLSFDASQLQYEVARSQAVAHAISAPVSGIAAAGSAAALLLVAAAGGLWVERRRSEVALLAAKGLSPATLGGKAVAEMLGPFLAGSVAGWGLGLLLVPGLGPSDLVNAGAPVAALARVGIVSGVGLVTLWVVAAVGSRARTELALGRGVRWPARVPWELALLGAAVPLYLHVRQEGVPVVSGGQLPGLTVAQLAFPLLFLVGTVLVGIRLVGWLLAATRGRGGGWPSAAYLASRRLTGSLPATLVFAATAALPIGVLVLCAGLTSTLRYTTEAKAASFVGSDAAFTVVGTPPIPASLRSRATEVITVPEASIGGLPADVLSVDPATFARAAFWDSRYADAPLSELLGRLRFRGSGPVPALVVGSQPGARFTLHLPDVATGRDLAAYLVGMPSVFPGQRANPLVVIDQRALVGTGALSQSQLWVRAPVSSAERAIAAAGIDVSFTVTAAQVSTAPDLIAIQWTFGFLESLGVLAGIIAVGGLLLYLQTRQRSRQLAYAFARRMGLSRRGHRRSLLLESGFTLGVGYVLGAALSAAAALIVYRYLDPEPFVPPGPLYTNPDLTLVGIAGAVAALCGLAAIVVQATADRADRADLLRLGQ